MYSVIITYDEKPGNVHSVVEAVLIEMRRFGMLEAAEEATVLEYTGSYEIAIVVGTTLGSGILAGLLGLYGEKIAEWTVSSAKGILQSDSQQIDESESKLQIDANTAISKLEKKDDINAIEPIIDFAVRTQKRLNEIGMEAPRFRFEVSDLDRGSISFTHSVGEETLVKFEPTRSSFGGGEPRTQRIIEISKTGTIDLPKKPKC